jgi:hypothetical protein
MTRIGFISHLGVSDAFKQQADSNPATHRVLTAEAESHLRFCAAQFGYEVIEIGASQWMPATDNEYLPWRFVTKATIEDQHGNGTP